MSDQLTISQDIEVHFVTLFKWIISCDKSDQLPICAEAVTKLFVNRFSSLLETKEINATDFSMMVKDLEAAMKQQAIIIAGRQSDKRHNNLTSGINDIP